MFLAYDVKKGVKYAKWTQSKRIGGKVVHECVNIGRVLDEKRGIFRSRERGVFTFDPASGTFGAAPADFVPPRTHRGKERLILDFGDAYVLERFIQAAGLEPVIDAIGYGNPDTLRAMLFHYTLCGMANSHAESWWEGSYARLLFPRADLRSQRISEFLSAIGAERVRRRFFAAYLATLRNEWKTLGNVLVDSTGLPNSIRFPLTAVSNHNGKVSNEVRLVYVLHRPSGLPLYFRCCPGNVIDVSTLVRTVGELAQLGVSLEELILDAGYYDVENLELLFEKNIAFVLRLKENLRLRKRLLAERLPTLARKENLVRFHDRFVYLERVPCKPDGEHDAWAYLGLDLSRKGVEADNLFRRAARTDMDPGEVHDALAGQGVFALLASRPIETNDILPTYFARQEIEQVFDLGKNNVSLLPLRVQTETALNGHLLLTFLATVLHKRLQTLLKDSSYTPVSLFQNLRNQKCKVYEAAVIPQEPAKKAHDAYKLLHIPCLAKLSLPSPAEL